MKPSGGQYRSDVGESGPLSRGTNQHVSALTTTRPGGHPVYLAQHQSLSAAHLPPFASQSSGGSPHGPSEYHPHHLPPGDLPHRSHLPAPGIGINPGHVPMHMPQRRRTSGHRLSLLWDIGVAGERERDRAESSTAGSGSHVIPGAVVYGGRPNMSMMSSLGLQASQRNLASSSVSAQPPPGTPPRHSASTGQLNRPSTSLHGYPAGGGSSFMLPGPSSIKTEPGTFVKEESKSPLHSVTPHYPQMVHSQTFSAHPAIHTSSQGDQQADKETENMPSKESLLQSMEKVDKEINKIASEIKGLERKKQQLETVAKKPQQTEKSTSPKKVETKHKDLWQVIYAENKRKAEAARGLLDHLCPRYDMPLYNQPSDTKVYQENLKKNEEMRPKLLAYFQRRSQLSNIRERYLCARYDELMSEWQRKAERIENNVKRKTKEAKVREFFEKQFPEIRKQREQQERFTRSGTRGDACRSEADFNEIVDGLSEQENQEQHMRQLAVVPPMLLDRDERRLKFFNNNGLVTDPMEDYKKRQELDHWSEQEKEIFKEKYVQHPKNFHLIASFLEKKSVNDCVLFYYLSKKKAGYKNLVRKNTLKTRKVKPVRGHAQQASNSSGQDVSKNGQQVDKGVGDKFAGQKDSLEGIVKEEEIERIDRPPSPRITRSRNKNMNWTDEDIVMAKEGFGKHGKDFAAISRLFSNKTEVQIKHFYTHYKKKHNLDQLISDGKKKKPRTRTQAQNSESSSATPPDSDSSSLEVSRPRSADPQVSTDQPEPTKKRKKEADMEKKEEQKTDISKTTESTSVSAPDVDMTPAPPRVISSSMSQIRTRRSAVVSTSNVESFKGQGGKRSSESSPVEEPAEKKPRKSKQQTKDSKSDIKEIDPEEKKTEDPPKAPENAEAQSKKDENGADDVKEPKEHEKPPSPVSIHSEPSTTTISTSPVTSTSTENTVVVDTPVVAAAETTPEITPSTKTETPPVSDPSPVIVPQSKPSQPSIMEQPTEEQITSAVLPLQRPADNSAGNDGDSSATCSADEEPNLQDTEMKVISRKHTDSPYAFEDESSASIKLESSRTPMPPLSSAQSLQVKGRLPETETSQGGRPSSTHPPQPVIVKIEDKRPQSLPPPPGAIPPAMVPISALTFQPPVRKQTPSSHIVGKVPDAFDIRRALQTVQVPSVPNTAMPHSGTEKYIKPELLQTIDLTVASSVESSKSKEQSQRLPHYHQVPKEAMSLHKDFSQERKSNIPPREEPALSRHREYTQSDLASMRERAAAIPIPIPVSSLRAPMPGMTQRKEISRPEPNVKKEVTPTPPEMSATSKHLLVHPGQQPIMARNPASIGHPHLTTSSIPTKIISSSMASVAPLRQNQLSSSHAPGLQIPNEARRMEVISPIQSMHHSSEAGQYRRSPVPEPASHPHIPLSMRSYPDIMKTTHPISRSSIVKIAGAPNLEPVLPDERKGKSGPGSITTGVPVHRSHDDRTEQRTALIAGKLVAVKQPQRASPLLEQTRLQEPERQPHNMLRFPPPSVAHGHPALIPGLPQKPLQSAGSIHDGRPVVKRKASDESNPSLSPSANPTPYQGLVVSRPSPTAVTSATRLPERTPLALDRNMEAMRAMYGHALLADRGLKEAAELYHPHRQTPEKLVREPAARVPSPSHRRTPTGPSLAQHPAIKQELPGSPHSAEELLRQQPQPLPMLLGQFGLPQIPLTTPGVSKDFLEILRQYRPPGAPPILSMFVSPPSLPAQYTQLLNPAASPHAPGSPQNDDGRETTKKMLNQDFKTAQIMTKLRHPAQPTMSTTYGFLPGVPPTLTAPGIGPPPLVVSTPSLYHPMTNPYPGLAVDRVNFIPTHHAYPPHLPQQSGRSSAESNRSPSHRPPSSLSPDERHRHRSSDMPTEFSNHPATKERNSSTSPYRFLRENPSPLMYAPPGPGHPQLSPSHLSQLPPKQYRNYPHSSTPPLQSTHHRSIPKSSHLATGMHLAYGGQEAPTRIHESQFKHIRSGSFDGSLHQSLERSRPSSASPHPKSLPQSPNDIHHEQSAKYSTHTEHPQSPKYRHEQKMDSQPVHVIANEQRVLVREDRPTMMQHRERSRLPPKHPLERGDTRPQQHPIMVAGSHQGTPPLPLKQEPRSSMQHRERPEQAPKVQDHAKSDHKQTADATHGISTNPGVDLKTCGRTKMKAATLIDHIINMNFDVSTSSKTPEPADRAHRPPATQKSAMPAQMIPGSSHSGDTPQKRPREEAPLPKRESTPSKQPAFEAETKPSLVPTRGYQPHPFTISAFGQSPVAPLSQGQDKTSSSIPLTHSLTFAKHSSDVIEQCYREVTPGKRGSPARTVSPAPTKPAALVTEPISPPEKRLSAARSENKPPPPQAVYSPFLSQERFSTPAAASVARTRVEPSSMEQPGTFPLPVRPSVVPAINQTGITQAGSLEDIIRKALMNGDKASADVQQSRNKQSLGGLEAPLSDDLILSQAVYASMSAHRPNVHHEVAASAQKPPQAVEERKGTPPTAQPQSGSEKYVSALMFRTPTQNATPPAAERHQHAFYQAQARAAAASQSPAPPEPNQSQNRIGMLPMPQYEALSDSD